VYPLKKTSNFRIRVEPNLHEDFLDACKSEDLPAAQVLRSFMKDYVKTYREGLQSDFFVAEELARYRVDVDQDG